MSFPTVSAAAPTVSGAPAALPTDTPAATSAPATPDYPPEYWALRSQESQLQGQLQAQQAELDRQRANASVSWLLSQVFRQQEEAERDAAQDNDELTRSANFSSIMSTSATAARKDAVTTAQAIETTEAQLASVRGQIAAIEAAA
jgi:hypothetical protein